MRTLLLKILLFSLILFTVGVEANEPYILRLWLPGNDWAFEVDMDDYLIQKQELNQGFNGRSLSGICKAKRNLLTVELELVNDEMSLIDYRDSVLQQQLENPVRIDNVKKYEKNGFVFLEYYLKSVPNFTNINQRNVFVYYLKNSHLISVHLSGQDTKDEDNKKYDKLLESLQILDGYKPTSFDYFIFGSWSFRKGDYISASQFYEQSLNLEKNNRALPRDYWLVLVDNLAMAYGISGESDNARRILKYGLTIEPQYTMFHYNMACCYAEDEKFDSTIACLTRFYEFKNNMIAGEKLPDPFDDNSFKRYWDNKKFKELISKIRK